MLYRKLTIAALTLAAAQVVLSAGVLLVNPATRTVSLGAQATVQINITGDEVGDFDLDIGWNAMILSLNTITFGTQLGGPINSIQGTAPGAGTVNAFEISLLSIADLLALQPAGATLLTLKFDTLGVGTNVVTLGVNAIGDEAGLPLTGLSLVNGQINVTDGGGGIIPEPASWLLSASALVVLICLRRRCAA